MASNSNNHTAHSDFDPNLRIKAEPGTDGASSASTSMRTSDSSVQNVLASVKVEPGFTTSNNRLPSFFGRRDLTLGGNVKFEKPKRIYTPNVNAQRLKNREDPNTVVKNQPATKREKGRIRVNNEKERGKDGRGRGRGKATTNNLIQSAGVFSEGLVDSFSGSRRSSGHSSHRERDSSGGSEKESLQRPRLSVPRKVDKAEEEEKIKKLLRDDFIADRMDVDEDNAPLMLPMLKEAKGITKSNYKAEEKVDTETVEGAKLPNGEVKEPDVKSDTPPKIEKDTKSLFTISQVLAKNAKSSNYVLLQLPDCLPGLRGNDENPIAGPSKENGENETEKASNYCTVSDLKEGMLGKLQILKSGKARMVLGDNNLTVELGSTVSFRQDLIAAKITSEEQELVNLGRVNSSLVCALDWQDLIKIL